MERFEHQNKSLQQELDVLKHIDPRSYAILALGIAHRDLSLENFLVAVKPFDIATMGVKLSKSLAHTGKHELRGHWFAVKPFDRTPMMSVKL